MTMRRLAWLVLGILGLVFAIGALWSTFGSDRVTLTAAQLQERVNRALPREFKGVTVDQATVSVAGGRVSLRVDTRAAALGQSVKGTVSARGVPRLAAERGEIFFDADEVKVTDFAVTGGNIATRIERLGAALRERVETAAGHAIAAGLKAYLADRPVYRFKDDLKGIVLKAAISDIATRDDAIVITIALVRITLMAAVCVAALLAILVLIVVLLRHPAWGALARAAAAPDGADSRG
jgi:hypothetical protein